MNMKEQMEDCVTVMHECAHAKDIHHVVIGQYAQAERYVIDGTWRVRFSKPGVWKYPY